MTTPISPSVGQGLMFLEGGPGQDPGYGAIGLRRALSIGLQEGVVDANSYKVTEKGAGADMSVDVDADDPGGAVVEGDTISAQGLYTVAPHSTTINESIAAADPTDPRIDQAILEAADDTHAAGGLNEGRVRIVAGTPTAGATKDNRSGAASLPASAIRLADIEVGAGATSITDADIRDRRPWARGAHKRVKRTSNASAVDDYTNTNTSFVEVDATNIKPRIECSGALVVAELLGEVSHGSDNAENGFRIWIDGAQWDGNQSDHSAAGASGLDGGVLARWVATPSAGSHQFSPAWAVSAGTGTLAARATSALIFRVYEDVRQDTSND